MWRNEICTRKGKKFYGWSFSLRGEHARRITMSLIFDLFVPHLGDNDVQKVCMRRQTVNWSVNIFYSYLCIVWDERDTNAVKIVNI